LIINNEHVISLLYLNPKSDLSDCQMKELRTGLLISRCSGRCKTPPYKSFAIRHDDATSQQTQHSKESRNELQVAPHRS